MTILQRCGFFSDLDFGDEGDPTLADSLGEDFTAEDLLRIVTYLRRGIQYAVVPYVVEDVVATERRLIGPLVYLTDGEWVWRSDLPYYVEEYHCRIPVQFIAHMKSRNWIPPTKRDFDLSQLTM